MAREGKNRKGQSKGERPQSEFDQRIIDLARVTRVMAGGKRLRFRACVAIGDRKGRVGWAVAKGADVTIAVNKAVSKARKHLFRVNVTNETIPHQVTVKFGASKILLKPAKKGTGIIAGGAVRQILELAGIPNVYAKILGSKNKINNVQSVFDAFKILNKSEGYSKRAEESIEDNRERDFEKEEILEKEQEKILSKINNDSGIKIKE